MSKAPADIPTLAAVEAEVLAEGREGTRQRLAQRLQDLAAPYREVFPPEPATPAAPAGVSV